METGARYALVGLFTLAVAFAGFAFVYWLHHTGGLGERTTYQVQFEGNVSGLRPGSAVLFNGIRVGEVTNLQLTPTNPRGVTVTIVVERATPLRSDTQAGMEVQGLMGSPTVALRGGTSDAPLLASPRGSPAVLLADPGASQDTMQTAREVLRHIDKVITENSEPLRGTIANLNTFTGALARNSDRLDGIVEGLERMVGAGVKTPPTIYDLTAPHSFPALGEIPLKQLVIADPTTVVVLDSQRILIQAKSRQAPTFADAQWADTLPKLFQTKIIQSFENASFTRVSRPLDGLMADHHLLIDIRTFRIWIADNAPVAEIEFVAKVMGDGRIVDAQIFRAKVPAKALDAAGAAAALDEAFGIAVQALVPWVVKVVST